MKLKRLIPAVLCLTLLTGCGGISSFQKSLESGNFEKATADYFNRVNGSEDAKRDAREFVREFLRENIQNYADGDMTQSEIQEFVDHIRQLEEDTHLLRNDLEEILQDLDKIQQSRQDYSSAETALQGNNFPEAIEGFGKVIPEDTKNYESAQRKQEEIKTEYLDSLTAQAEKLMRQNDYAGAYQLVADAAPSLEESESYRQQLQSVLDAWVGDATAQAEQAFGGPSLKDYNAAIQALQSVTASDDRIAEAIQYYQEYIPLKLSEMEYTQKGRYLSVGRSWPRTEIDVNQNHYHENTLIFPQGGSLSSEFAKSENDAYVNYYLNADYSTLTGTLYRPYVSLSSTNEEDWEEETVVRIYGDGRLLYEAPNITKTTYDPIPLHIDITGVRELKIVMMGVFSENSGWAGSYTRRPRVCLAEMTVQK